ncbi:hypothetical protein E3T23_06575 [Cryobacterium cheniae]|uniref:Tyr recombinase domain-containing protein n=1 Tax=Cryobacterium cheniae TaxID=1259262 RepID=A0A4R8XUR4_9MICO|nr:tyrosine-type recombinase/integrase [Cryobacterium cheniae]TFC81157.1 hypothetical protein E3T23_06575 [Cryobacterium cheniae]
MTSALLPAAPVHNLANIAATLDASVAESTLKAYNIAQQKFRSYCGERGWSLYPTDASDSGLYVAQVLSYLQTLADDGKSVSTVNKNLSGIKFFASRESHLGFMILNSSREVKAFMAGISRTSKTTVVRKAQALTLEQLGQVHRSLQRRTAKNLRNRALIALGIGAALRSQSLADLNVSDVTSALAVNGLNVRIRWSKTDQTGEGREVTIARASNRKIDPVRAIQDWIDYLGSLGVTAAATPDAPLFPHVRGASVQVGERLSNASDAVSHIVRGVLLNAGVVTESGAQAYSSHSLRSTFITLSAQAGVTEAKVAAISGHKNMNILRGYDRTSEELAAQTEYLGS